MDFARSLFRGLSSFGFAVVLLLFLLLLTWLGTLEQVEFGLYEVHRRYFDSLFVVRWAGPFNLRLPAFDGGFHGSSHEIGSSPLPAARFGHTIHAFANGEEALAALSALSPAPELLITDVIMPGMNGRVLADHVAERLPNIRVLFVSGYPDDVIVHHGILKKGIEFLAKPFSIEQLTRRVGEVLDAPLGVSKSVLGG